MSGWSKPLVSIVVPMHNDIETIEVCISSIIHQQDAYLEVICVDDASHDGTSDIIHRMQKCHPSIVLLSADGVGPGAARNIGIQNSHGKYLAFCDADDYLEPSAISTMLDTAMQSDADVVCCAYWEDHTPDKQFYHESGADAKSKFEGFFENISVWNRLYSMDFIRRNQVAFPHAKRGEDRVFLAQVFLCNPSISFVDIPVYHWCRHPQKRNTTLDSAVTINDFCERLMCWKMFYTLLKDQYCQEAKYNIQCGIAYLQQQCDLLTSEKEREEAHGYLNVFLKSIGLIS